MCDTLETLRLALNHLTILRRSNMPPDELEQEEQRIKNTAPGFLLHFSKNDDCYLLMPLLDQEVARELIDET